MRFPGLRARVGRARANPSVASSHCPFVPGVSRSLPSSPQLEDEVAALRKRLSASERESAQLADAVLGLQDELKHAQGVSGESVVKDLARKLKEAQRALGKAQATAAAAQAEAETLRQRQQQQQDAAALGGRRGRRAGAGGEDSDAGAAAAGVGAGEAGLEREVDDLKVGY